MFKEKKVLHVLSEEYVNPFDSSLDTDCLYKLSSGVAIDTKLADQILMTERSGEESSRESLILLLWRTNLSLQATKFMIQ